MKYLTILLLTLFALPAARAQPVAVRASVDASRVGLHGTVVYTLEVEGAAFGEIETPAPPATEGLVLLQPVPSTWQNVEMVGNRVRQHVGFEWLYRPIRLGPAQVRPATVRVRGRSYTTEAITLEVTSQAPFPPGSRGAPPPGAAPPDRAAPDTSAPALTDADLYIKVVPSAREAVLGEQVTVEYLLYFREGVQIRQSRMADSWDAEGFWREELEVDTHPLPRSVNEGGARYNVITLKRVAVFPTRTGTLRIDPLRIETEVYVPSRSDDPFEFFFSRGDFEVVERASAPLAVQVRPLPGGAPPGFDGAVGSYRFTLRADSGTVEVGAPVNVEMEVQGAGNLATLAPPLLDVPDAFERYDPAIDLDVRRGGSRIEGSKTFRYTLVPQTNGRYELPAVVFTYFDPETGRYATQRSEPVRLRVTGAAAAPATAELPLDDVAGLMAEAQWRTGPPAPLAARAWVWATLALPALALLAVAGLRRRRDRQAADAEGQRRRQAHPAARRRLQAATAARHAGDARAFYDALALALLGFVGDRLGRPVHGWTRTRLDAQLADAGLDAAAREALRRLLDEADQARFAPLRPAPPALADAEARAAALLDALDAQLAHA